MIDESATHAGQTPRKCAAVLLAAGAGTRFEGINHKLLTNLRIPGENATRTIFEHALHHVREAGIGPVVVITGNQHQALTNGLASQEGLHGDALLLRHNNRWADGQSTSVWEGIRAAKELGCDRVVIGLADQPFISPQAWRLVAGGPGAITVATYVGRRRNPVGLDSDVWHLLPTNGDEGARTLMRVRPDLVSEVTCPGSPDDIDTEEDLRRWQNN
jgi:molybdenum cofactor cytidylyltransferase